MILLATIKGKIKEDVRKCPDSLVHFL